VLGVQVALVRALSGSWAVGYGYGVHCTTEVELKSLDGIKTPEVLEKICCLNRFWRLCADFWGAFVQVSWGAIRGVWPAGRGRFSSPSALP